jgi:hypothetical protein
VRGDHLELAAGPQQDGGELGHAGHAGVEHHHVEAVVLTQAADLLRVPDQDRRRRVDEAAGGDDALRVRELEGDDDVDVLGVEQAGRRGGLLLLLDQPGMDHVAVLRQRVGDLLGRGGRGRPHVRRLAVVVLQERHDEDADPRPNCHR